MRQRRGPRPPIYDVPVEILLIIFKFLAPPRTRDFVYSLLQLTHVCRFWRIALINDTRAWATVFVTKKDRRSFIQMCIERSYPAPLDVTVDVQLYGSGPVPPSCTCDRNRRSRLVPKHIEPGKSNRIKPCEWHFTFEPLAETKHSKRIHALNLQFDYHDSDISAIEYHVFEPRSCRFFNSPYIKPTNLIWQDHLPRHNPDFPLPSSFLSPALRVLSFRGRSAGCNQIENLSDLTSFTFNGHFRETSPESLRTVFLNNQSLEAVSLQNISFEGSSNGCPVTLPKLKLFSVFFNICSTKEHSQKTLSTLCRVPALRRISSLRFHIGCNDNNQHYLTLYATGDDIAFTINCNPKCIAGAWRDLTGYAGPTIQHVRLENPFNVDFGGYRDDGAAVALFADAHTLEIGKGCVYLYPGFLSDLKELGRQLKTIRFGVPEETPLGEIWGGNLLDSIEELLLYRFEHGRPVSSVERLVVSGDEGVNRQQDVIWGRFYEDRRLYRYVQGVGSSVLNNALILSAI